MNLRTRKLGRIAEIDRAGISACDIPAGTPYLGLEHIEAGGRILASKPVAAGELASAKFRFGPEHLLYGKLRPYLAKIALPDFSGICSTDLVPIRPSSHVDRRYLAYFLRQPAMVAYASSRATGINLPRLSPRSLADFDIPLPSLPEQRRIASILDQAEIVRRGRSRALDRHDHLHRALFIQMFAEQGAHWEPVTVEGLADNDAGGIRTGPFGSQLLHSEFTETGISVLGIDNAVSNEFRWSIERFISSGKYAKLRRYKVNPGDVLITIMGTCGRCAVVPDDIGEAINTKHLCCISLDRKRCLPQFLHAYFLYHPHARRHLDRHSRGAIMQGLNMGIIKELPVLLPPLELQKEFVRRAAELSSQRAKAASAFAVADRLFASLQHRAFRGEL